MTPRTPDHHDAPDPPDHPESSEHTEDTDFGEALTPDAASTPGRHRLNRGRWSLIPANTKRSALPDLRSLAPRLGEPLSRLSTTARTWLREALSPEAPPTGHRLHPKLRALQLGTAVAAVGVLSTVVGNVDSPSEDQTVQAAAQVAPLNAVSPQVALESRSAPAAQSAPQALAAPEQPAGDRTAARGGDVQSKRMPAFLHPALPLAALPQPAQPPKDPLDGWISEATKVLQASGVPADKIDPDDIRTIIEHESGGNPSASNNWDSNASKGTPSKGLMQTIEPTFHSFALPGHQNIWNPVDNIVAATRYSIDRYGSVSEVPGLVGKASGGDYRGY